MCIGKVVVADNGSEEKKLKERPDGEARSNCTAKPANGSLRSESPCNDPGSWSFSNDAVATFHVFSDLDKSVMQISVIVKPFISSTTLCVRTPWTDQWTIELLSSLRTMQVNWSNLVNSKQSRANFSNGKRISEVTRFGGQKWLTMNSGHDSLALSRSGRINSVWVPCSESA